jgi:hypothetical protein
MKETYLVTVSSVIILNGEVISLNNGFAKEYTPKPDWWIDQFGQTLKDGGYHYVGEKESDNYKQVIYADEDMKVYFHIDATPLRILTQK